MVQNERSPDVGEGRLPPSENDLLAVWDEIRPLVVRAIAERFRGGPFAPLDGSLPFTGTVSCTVPHVPGTAQFVRAIEFDAFVNLAFLIIGGKQDLDLTLTGLAALTTAANQMIYSTGPNAFAMTSLSAFARTLLDDTSAAAARTTLGASSSSHTHRAEEISLRDPPWTGSLAGSGIRNVQDLADWIDANVTVGGP